jgi:hypothetical protein
VRCSYRLLWPLGNSNLNLTVEFGQPSMLLCLGCGNLALREEMDGVCPSCASSIDAEELIRLYKYGAHVYYYGHQYRRVYEAQEETEDKPRFYLEFAGEAFAWTMLAVLSGVVGNAAYDLVKVVAANIRREVQAGRLPSRDYSPLLALSDNELSDLFNSAKCYTSDMDGLTKEVRLAIIEEIAVNAMVHEPKLISQMTRVMNGAELTDKQRTKFFKLLRTVVAREQAKVLPTTGRLNNLWTRAEPRK